MPCAEDDAFNLNGDWVFTRLDDDDRRLVVVVVAIGFGFILSIHRVDVCVAAVVATAPQFMAANMMILC
jgi:hypothetical protein